MAITRKDLAEKLGLSERAVSFALSDSSDARKQLRPETRARVLAAAQQMNYQPNRLARGLTSGKTGTIGLVMRTVNHPAQSALNERLLQLISEAGFETLMRMVPDLDDTRAIEELYCAHRPEALVVGPVYEHRPPPFLRQLLRRGFPLVSFEALRPFPGDLGDLVTHDIAALVRLSVAHLRERGHVRIGHVGWSRVARAAFLAIPGLARRHCHKRWGSFANGYDFALAWEPKPDGPTAYHFEDPRFALGFERGAYQRGIRIPADVAFVVSAYTEMGDFSPLPVTTVGPSLNEMAKTIVDLAVGRIRGQIKQGYQTVTLEARLVCGESSGGARTDVRPGDPFLVARAPSSKQPKQLTTKERQRS